jgi:hypothetical protein
MKIKHIAFIVLVSIVASVVPFFIGLSIGQDMALMDNSFVQAIIGRVAICF